MKKIFTKVMCGILTVGLLVGVIPPVQVDAAFKIADGVNPEGTYFDNKNFDTLGSIVFSNDSVKTVKWYDSDTSSVNVSATHYDLNCIPQLIYDKTTSAGLEFDTNLYLAKDLISLSKARGETSGEYSSYPLLNPHAFLNDIKGGRYTPAQDGSGIIGQVLIDESYRELVESFYDRSVTTFMCGFAQTSDGDRHHGFYNYSEDSATELEGLDIIDESEIDTSVVVFCFFNKIDYHYYYYYYYATRHAHVYDTVSLKIYQSPCFFKPTTHEVGFDSNKLTEKLYNNFEYTVKQLFSENANKELIAGIIDKNYSILSCPTSDGNSIEYMFLPLMGQCTLASDTGYTFGSLGSSGLNFKSKIVMYPYVFGGNKNGRYFDYDVSVPFDVMDSDYYYPDNFFSRADSFVLDKDTIVWGETGITFQQNNPNSISYKAISYLMKIYGDSIMNGIQCQSDIYEYSQGNFMADYANESFIKSELIKDFVIMYSEQLGSAIKTLALDNFYESYYNDLPTYFEECKDYEELLAAVLKYNIACMDPNSNVRWETGPYKVGFKHEGREAVFVCTQNMDSVSSLVKNGEKSVITFKEILSKVSTTSQVTSYWMYRYTRDLYSTYASHNNVVDLSGWFLKTNYSNAESSIVVDQMSFIDYTAIKCDRYEYNINASGTILSQLKYTDILGVYGIANVLYNMNNDDIYSYYDADLDAALKHKYVYDLNEFYFPDLPLVESVFLEKYGKFLFDSDYALTGESGYDTPLSRFINHLFTIAYGFEIANGGSSYSRENGYSAADIADYFGVGGTYSSSPDTVGTMKSESGAGQSPANGNFGEYGNYMLRAVIELHDFCELMGIDKDSWTDSIRDYLILYEQLEAANMIEQLRNNSNLYNVNIKGSTTVEDPLGTFFSVENQNLSDQWIKGFALSATFSPMNTNLYNADWAEFLGDVEWTSEFYYKYGFYRKALFINTDSSAIVNKFITGADSPTKVATLRDLLTYDRDIVLTVDDNFYNADQLATVLGMIDYASVKNNNQLQSEETGTKKEIFINIKELFDVQPEVVLKTGANKYYSSEVFKGATPLGADEETSESSYDAYLLMKKDILNAIDAQEYSIQQPMAIVSAIYKSDKLFNQMLKCASVDNAIFKSSKAIASTPGTKESDWLALYNYYMLSNLSEQMRNDSSSTLDLDAPIFCDIFGNIVTESGLVIIPAASNATLCGAQWTPMSVGWADYYYNGDMIKFDDCSLQQLEFLTGAKWEEYADGSRHMQAVAGGIIKESPCGGGWFSVDGDYLQIRTSEVHSANSSAVIQWSNLSKNSDNIKQIFYNHNYFDVGPNLYNYVTTNMISEVLRGAPIEHIDYKKEALDGLKSATRFGVVAAYGLEKVSDTVLSSSDGNFKVGNSMTTLPNVAFLEGIEYIVLFAFKIMFAAGIIMLAINLYTDAVQEQLGIKSVIRFGATLVLTLLAILVVPQVLNWSYYRANKALLTDDILYVQMLNYTKDFDGAEINVTTIDTPKSNTELYLKLDDISLDWWDVLYEVLFESTNATVTELYEEELSDNSYYGAPGVEIKSDGVYISIDDIFDSTTITYLPGSKTLVNYTYKESDNLVASYVTPYYYFLDQLVQNINVYNSESAVEAYSYGIGQNGHLYTYELSAPYFRSAKFTDEGYDLLNLHHMFGTNSGSVKMPTVADAQDIELMKFSLWWPSEMATEDMYEKVDDFYKYAKDYVANNAELLGKVPDEVFIKTMAMRLAVKWNNMFNIPMGDSIEIMNVDTRDLMRLIAGDRVDVYRYSSYGLARFIYEEGGIMGCIAAALFLGIVWVSNIFKAVVMIVIMGLLIVNVFFRRTIYRGEGNLCIEGYVVTCGLLAGCNLLYALMLKLCLTVTEYGMGTSSSFLFALVVQILYLAALLGILMVVVKDWNHSGLLEWQNIGATVTHSTKEMLRKVTSGFRRGGHGNNRGHASSGMGEVTVASMLDRDAYNEDQFVRENR